MAQTGYTPISIYYSATATNTPTAGNLVAGELAINTADGKLFYKDSSGVVQTIAGKGGAGVAGGSTTQVQYNSSGSLAGSANMTFSGTALTLANDASISGLTVGKGGGAVATNTAVGVGIFQGSATGTSNTAVGYNSLFSISTGSSNTGVGRAVLGSNTTGSFNTAVGQDALGVNSTASNNTAVGYQSLYANSTGTQNTAVGMYSGFQTTTATNNVAVGYASQYANTTGSSNSSFGDSALYANTTGGFNTAIGKSALQSNTTASSNTAVGYQAGYSNTVNSFHTYLGFQAGYSNVNGSYNTCVGYQAGFSNNPASTGNTLNTFIGYYAGQGVTTGTLNTFIGGNASGYLVTTGGKNTIIGNYTGNQGGLDIRTSSNYIVLSDGDGNPRAYWNATGQATFTATSGTGLSVVNNFTGNGTPLILTQSATNAFNAMEIRNSGGTAVFIVAANGNATNTNNSYGGISDIKLKENIVDATPKLDDLMQVKVRNYNLIGNTQKQIGVVAQELEQVFAGLVEETIDIDAEGNDLGTTTKSVKYSVFVPMLIKAVQELKAEVDSLKQQLGK